MTSSTLRDTQTAELAGRIDPIISRLWMLRGDAVGLLAGRLATGIVLTPRAPDPDEAATQPALGVAVLLH